jgi:hypothetical protein
VVAGSDMTIFRAKQKTPLPVIVICISPILVSILVPLYLFLAQGLDAQKLINFLGMFALCLGMAYTLWKIYAAQKRAEISDEGFKCARLRLAASFPPVTIKEEFFQWKDVQDFGGRGFDLFFLTTKGKRAINLFLFDQPDAVKEFAFEVWKKSTGKS